MTSLDGLRQLPVEWQDWIQQPVDDVSLDNARALAYQIPRLPNGDLDMQSLKPQERRLVDRLSPLGFERVRQLQALNRMGFAGEDLSKADRDLMQFYTDKALPDANEAALLESLVTNESAGETLSRILTSPVTGAARMATGLYYGINSKLFGVDPQEMTRNLGALSEEERWNLAAMLGEAPPDPLVYFRALREKWRGSEKPFHEIYQQIAKIEGARVEGKPIASAVEMGGEMAGQIGMTFGRNTLLGAKVFTPLEAQGSRLARQWIANTPKLDTAMGRLATHWAAQAGTQGVAYGALSGLQNYYDPQTGEAKDGAEMALQGVFESAMFPVFVGLSHAAGNIAAKIRTPQGKRWFNEVMKFAREEGGKPGMSQLPREVLEKPEEYFRFWHNLAKDARLPDMIRNSTPREVTALLAQSGLEGAGFSALDMEFWGDLLSGDWSQVGRKLLTNTLGIGILHAGRTTTLNDIMTRQAPPLGGDRPIAPGVEQPKIEIERVPISIRGDRAPVEYMGEVPYDVRSLGYRLVGEATPDGPRRYALEARRDLWLEENGQQVIASPELQKIAERMGLTPVDAAVHMAIRDSLDLKRRMQGMGRPLDVDGTRAVEFWEPPQEPGEPSRVVKEVDGRIYERTAADGTWRRLERPEIVQGPRQPVSDQQKIEAMEVARQLWDVEASQPVKETLLEAIRTLMEVPREVDKAVDEALRLAQQGVDLQGNVVPSALEQIVQMRGEAKTVKGVEKPTDRPEVQSPLDWALTEFAGTAAGRTTAERAWENIVQAGQLSAARTKEAAQREEEAQRPAKAKAGREAAGLGVEAKGGKGANRRKFSSSKKAEPTFEGEPVEQPTEASKLGLEPEGRRGENKRRFTGRTKAGAKESSEATGGEKAGVPEWAKNAKTYTMNWGKIAQRLDRRSEESLGEELEGALNMRDMGKMAAMSADLENAAYAFRDMLENARERIAKDPEKVARILHEAARRTGDKTPPDDLDAFVRDVVKPSREEVETPDWDLTTMTTAMLALQKAGFLTAADTYPLKSHIASRLDMELAEPGEESGKAWVNDYAKQDTEAAPVHGDVREQQGAQEGQGQVPKPEGGEGVRKGGQAKAKSVERGYKELVARARQLGIPKPNQTKLGELRRKVAEAEAELDAFSPPDAESKKGDFPLWEGPPPPGSLGVAMKFGRPQWVHSVTQAAKWVGLQARRHYSEPLEHSLMLFGDRGEKVVPPAAELAGMEREALWDLARSLGVYLPEKAKKEDILDKLEARRDIVRKTSETFQRATNESHRLEGSWNKQIIPDIQRAATATVSRELSADWRTGKVEGGEYHISKLQAHNDGLADLSGEVSDGAKRVLKGYEDLGWAINQEAMGHNLWIQVGPSRWIPFKVVKGERRMPRVWAEEGRDLILKPDEHAYNFLVRAIADIPENNLSVRDVHRIFDSIRKDYGDITEDFVAAEARDVREHSRQIRVMPDRITVDGRTIRILETDAYHAADAMARRTASRLGYISQFGQRVPQKAVDSYMEKHPEATPPKPHADEMFQMYVHSGGNVRQNAVRLLEVQRSANGLDISGPMASPGGPVGTFIRTVIDPAIGLWTSARLSGLLTGAVNAWEPTNTLATYAGYRDVFGEMKAVYGAVLKAVGGNRQALVDLFTEARSMNAAVLDPVRLPAFTKGDRAKNLTELGRVMGGIQLFFNTMNEIVAVRVARRIQHRFENGVENGTDHEVIRMMELPKDVEGRILDGKGTAEDWDFVTRRLPAWTQGTGRPAQLGRFQQLRWARKTFKFQTFIRNYWRHNLQLARLAGELIDMEGRGWLRGPLMPKTDRGKAINRILRRSALNKSLFAMSSYWMYGVLRYGLNAIGLVQGDDEVDTAMNVLVDTLLMQSVYQELQGPVIRSFFVPGEGDVLDKTIGGIPLVDIVRKLSDAAPLGAVWEPSGRFTNEGWPDRMEKLLRAQVPLLNDVLRWGVWPIHEGDGPSDYRAATKRLYDWKRDQKMEIGGTETRSGYKPFTAVMRDFMQVFRSRGASGETLGDEDLMAILFDAADIKGKRDWDAVIGSLSWRKMLHGLDDDQRRQLREEIGPDNYEVLREHDNAIDRWIDWARIWK